MKSWQINLSPMRLVWLVLGLFTFTGMTIAGTASAQGVAAPRGVCTPIEVFGGRAGDWFVEIAQECNVPVDAGASLRIPVRLMVWASMAILALALLIPLAVR